MNLDALTDETELDLLFSYPERASLNCPPGARARLKGLLEAESELVWRAPGLVAWMGTNGPLGWVNYTAESSAVLEAEAPRFLAYFKALGRQAGITQFHIYAGSDAGNTIYQAAGLKLLHETLRMRHDAPVAMAEDPRLRPFRDEDVDAVLALMRASFPDQDTSLETWRACIYGNWQTWLSVLEGEPAGYILIDATMRTLMINGLGVSPHHQGHGLGKLLVRKVLDLAVRHDKVAVEVLADAKPGVIPFYESLGFTPLHRAYYLVQPLTP